MRRFGRRVQTQTTAWSTIMGLNLSEISEGVFYAQYIGWDPAMQVFRNRPNHSLVRVQVIKGDDGGLLVAVPHAKSPSLLNPVRLDRAIKDWRFVRRVRMSTRMLPVQRSESGRSAPPPGESADAAHDSSPAGVDAPGVK